MDLSSLKVFKTVAVEGSISKASEKLNYVQSNVTARIQQLEKELNQQLFYRHSRGITLTPSGEIFLKYAEDILQLCDEAISVVMDSETPRGKLKIGSIDETAAVQLPFILSSYHKKYPAVELSLSTGPSIKHIESILQYELDGAFVVGPVNRPDLREVSVTDEELVLISSSSVDIDIDLSTLLKNPFLKLSNVCIYREKFEEWLKKEGFGLDNIIEFSSLEGIISCVKSGFGISLLPKSLVKRLDPEESIVCHSIPEDYRRMKVSFIWRNTSYISTPLKKFLEDISK